MSRKCVNIVNYCPSAIYVICVFSVFSYIFFTFILCFSLSIYNSISNLLLYINLSISLSKYFYLSFFKQTPIAGILYLLRVINILQDMHLLVAMLRQNNFSRYSLFYSKLTYSLLWLGS
ncbi:MAG: hypothetical protein JG780_1351 [Thermosipho sp. (in: Bacteria)]|jgi:hypothetical protein|nr:hypothetical protein [Thermosipho sp. (in: thermotogales)]